MARRNNCEPGIVYPESPTPDSLAEATGPPRFLEDPIMNVPCSSTPAGPPRSATAAHRYCLPPNSQRRLPRYRNFGAQSHGPLTRCLRFAGWVAPPPRKTRFRTAGQPFRAGLITRWVPSKGFRFTPFSFPRLCLAHDFYTQKSPGASGQNRPQTSSTCSLNMAFTIRHRNSDAEYLANLRCKNHLANEGGGHLTPRRGSVGWIFHFRQRWFLSFKNDFAPWLSLSRPWPDRERQWRNPYCTVRVLQV